MVLPVQVSDSRVGIRGVGELLVVSIGSEVDHGQATEYEYRNKDNPYLELFAVRICSCDVVGKFIFHQVPGEFVDVGEHAGLGLGAKMNFGFHEVRQAKILERAHKGVRRLRDDLRSRQPRLLL